MRSAGSGDKDVKQQHQVLQQFRQMGVPEDQLQQYAAQRAGGTEGEAANEPALASHLWPAVELAMCLRTQLRCVAGNAGLLYLGLDYARLDGTKRDLGLPMRGPAARALLRQFRVAESEMMNVLNERAAGTPRQSGTGNTKRRAG